MRANRTEYLFSVNTHTPPTMTRIELIPFGTGKSAILRHSVCCAVSFRSRWPSPHPCATAAPGLAGAYRYLSTPTPARSRQCRPKATSHLTLGPTAAIFDQKDAGQGSRIYLPVLVEDALVFFGDPPAAISDGIITGTGIECSMNVRRASTC
jgi:hypothetical protein